MLTGKIVEVNGAKFINCYPNNFPIGTVPGEQDGAKVLGLYWATPISNNGVTVTDWQYSQANGSTPPTADSFKTLCIQEDKDFATYKYVLVPNDYTISAFVTANCSGCSPIAAVVVPDPIIVNTVCVKDDPECPPCSYKSVITLPSGSDYTIEGFCNGMALSPASVTGADATAAAAAAQSAWGSALGSGTFVASGNTITASYSTCTSFGVRVTVGDESS